MQKLKTNIEVNKSSDKESLEIAFNEFNASAGQLTSTHQELSAKIEQLTRELSSERAKHQPNDSRLSHLLSSLPAGVLVIDNRGCVQEVNPAAIDLLGGAFGGKLVGELWRHIIERTIEPSIHAGQESRLKDGRTVSMSTCPLGNEPGQIILLMDVTETRFLQQSLERHQRLSAMGEMSAKVAHQVRTPLASALLYVSNLNKGNLAEADRTRFISKALARLQHMENVVEDMLSFSRVGEIGQDIVALSDLIDELQIAMETHLESSGCVLYVEDMPENIAICANRDALLGVLQNLISNAIQVTGEGGIFSLSIEPVQQHHGIPSVDIQLTDNGPGIPENSLDKIFEPFFTTRAQGTGLGLSVAKAVVENHGGSIWVESTGSDGTTFITRLPMIKSADLNGISPK
ncbi:MAG: ATP-binding protein [Gammaproteobacteria bacterium]|nr:ATP-binding protein [Gammaproteobacteria bacterium]